MLPAVLWLIYALPAYILWPLLFPLRYGFWPIAGRFPPRNLYGWIDALLGVWLVAYSAWIVLGHAPIPDGLGGTIGGLALWCIGAALRWWAVAALGPHWRIGQDESDQRAEFVAAGPYRFIRHPINAALILVAGGQALMTGLDARPLMLLALSVLYFLIQGRAEERRWKPK
jgi:protein-S-isoprenylcysteine O-methyltransferase Ste14